VAEEVAAGEDTFFVGTVETVENGPPGRPLVHVDGRYASA
jgi:flavin reductase (DIM6/NTAB) family NADH-FMN oxidoreductase RutF